MVEFSKNLSLTRAEVGVAGVNGVPMTSIGSCFTVTGDSHPVSVSVGVGVGAGEVCSRLPPTLGSCTYTTRCVCMTCQVGVILNAALTGSLIQVFFIKVIQFCGYSSGFNNE